MTSLSIGFVEWRQECTARLLPSYAFQPGRRQVQQDRPFYSGLHRLCKLFHSSSTSGKEVNVISSPARDPLPEQAGREDGENRRLCSSLQCECTLGHALAANEVKAIESPVGMRALAASFERTS